MVKKAMQKISDLTGLKLSGVTDETVERIMHAASYAFGSIVELIKKAFVNALTYGDTVVEKGHFVAAYSQWRGCLPEHNVMDAKDWMVIKPENSTSYLLPPRIEKGSRTATVAVNQVISAGAKKPRKKGQ
jgi:hypothetical protein